MPSSTSCAPAARGGCSPTTSPPGKRFITIFGSGGGMAPGNGFMTPCGVRFGWHQVARKSRKLPLWIANRSRRRKKGPRGDDAGKKVKGRKRHLLVDTLGLVLVAVVHAADIPDREGARWVLKKAWAAWPRLRRIWADGGYAGSLVRWVQPHAGGSLEIVRRQGKSKGFHVLPYRWIVERTFAWLGKYRRLSADIARGPQSTVSQNPKGILRKCELPVSGSNT